MQDYVSGFQERRAKVTDEVVDIFMSERPLHWKGNPRVERVVPVVTGTPGATAENADGMAPLTKNQLKKIEKEKMIAAKKAEKASAKEAK
jgi:tryptophanyl-tRNA synthetase